MYAPSLSAYNYHDFDVNARRNIYGPSLGAYNYNDFVAGAKS
jgi:hypothetical protein